MLKEVQGKITKKTREELKNKAPRFSMGGEETVYSVLCKTLKGAGVEMIDDDLFRNKKDGTKIDKVFLGEEHQARKLNSKGDEQYNLDMNSKFSEDSVKYLKDGA